MKYTFISDEFFGLSVQRWSVNFNANFLKGTLIKFKIVI